MTDTVTQSNNELVFLCTCDCPTYSLSYLRPDHTAKLIRYFLSHNYRCCRYTGGSGGMAAPQLRAPRPYSLGEDFQLCLRRF